MGNGEIMNNILEYKGYYTKVEYSAEDNVLYGKIEGIVDLVNYESESLSGVEKEFHSAVDDYLQFCKETNKQPNKVYKGSFNVRIAPDLHKAVAILASRNHESLNQTVESAIEWFIKKNGISA